MAKTVEQIVSEARAAIDEVDVAQARALHTSGAVFIDVREPAEREQGAIAGALAIPRGVLEWKLAGEPKLADTSQPVVVYCQSGGRSALSACTLRTMGYSQVKSLAGGYSAWDADCD